MKHGKVIKTLRRMLTYAESKERATAARTPDSPALSFLRQETDALRIALDRLDQPAPIGLDLVMRALLAGEPFPERMRPEAYRELARTLWVLAQENTQKVEAFRAMHWGPVIDSDGALGDGWDPNSCRIEECWQCAILLCPHSNYAHLDKDGCHECIRDEEAAA